MDACNQIDVILCMIPACGKGWFGTKLSCESKCGMHSLSFHFGVGALQYAIDWPLLHVAGWLYLWKLDIFAILLNFFLDIKHVPLQYLCSVMMKCCVLYGNVIFVFLCSPRWIFKDCNSRWYDYVNILYFVLHSLNNKLCPLRKLILRRKSFFRGRIMKRERKRSI